MTTTTHTPGPWTTCDSELWGHHEQSVMVYSSVEYEDGDADVAEVCGKSNALERAANVRLVAAAPDLLAALISLLPLARKSRDPNNNTIFAAEDAIAKAIGED